MSQHVSSRLPGDTFVSGGHSSLGESFLLSSAESKGAERPITAGWTLCQLNTVFKAKSFQEEMHVVPNIVFSFK